MGTKDYWVGGLFNTFTSFCQGLYYRSPYFIRTSTTTTGTVPQGLFGPLERTSGRECPYTHTDTGALRGREAPIAGMVRLVGAKKVLAAVVLCAGCGLLLRAKLWHKRAAGISSVQRGRAGAVSLDPTTNATRATAILRGDGKTLAGDRVRFEPGTLPMTNADAFRYCKVDPLIYKQHFTGTAVMVAHAAQHSLLYILLPKSGSSTARWVMKQVRRHQ